MGVCSRRAAAVRAPAGPDGREGAAQVHRRRWPIEAGKHHSNTDGISFFIWILF